MAPIGMRSLVLLQISALGKGFVARLALERLFSGVNAFVPL
jgi:hypothetical protein